MDSPQGCPDRSFSTKRTLYRITQDSGKRLRGDEAPEDGASSEHAARTHAENPIYANDPIDRPPSWCTLAAQESIRPGIGRPRRGDGPIAGVAELRAARSSGTQRRDHLSRRHRRAE